MTVLALTMPLVTAKACYHDIFLVCDDNYESLVSLRRCVYESMFWSTDVNSQATPCPYSYVGNAAMFPDYSSPYFPQYYALHGQPVMGRSSILENDLNLMLYNANSRSSPIILKRAARIKLKQTYYWGVEHVLSSLGYRCL